MGGPRSTATVSVLGILLFWAGVLGAAELVSGYSARSEYISSLASRGSPVAFLGVGALLASAVAHLAAARAVGRSKLCASLVLSSAVAVVVVALARKSCPDGPARCGAAGTGQNDWLDVVHAAGVGTYEVLALAAMVTTAVDAARGTAPWPRWLAPVSLALALGSVLFLAQASGADRGLWQRLWVLDHHAWLLVVVWAMTRRTPGHRGTARAARSPRRRVRR